MLFDHTIRSNEKCFLSSRQPPDVTGLGSAEAVGVYKIILWRSTDKPRGSRLTKGISSMYMAVKVNLYNLYVISLIEI